MAKPQPVDPEDVLHGKHMAAQRVEVPLSDYMVRLMAEELPFLDSHSRGLVYDSLRKHAEEGKPLINSQEELPADIKNLMDL